MSHQSVVPIRTSKGLPRMRRATPPRPKLTATLAQRPGKSRAIWACRRAAILWRRRQKIEVFASLMGGPVAAIPRQKEGRLAAEHWRSSRGQENPEAGEHGKRHLAAKGAIGASSSDGTRAVKRRTEVPAHAGTLAGVTCRTTQARRTLVGRVPPGRFALRGPPQRGPMDSARSTKRSPR